MYFIFAAMSDGSGYTHTRAFNLAVLLEFLITSHYDFYTIWHMYAEHGKDHMDIIYNNNPEESDFST